VDETSAGESEQRRAANCIDEIFLVPPPNNPVGRRDDPRLLSFQPNYLKLANCQPKPNKRKAYRPKKKVSAKKPLRKTKKKKVRKTGKIPAQRGGQRSATTKNQHKEQGFCKFCKKLIPESLS
jgi:hypothetical protein